MLMAAAGSAAAMARAAAAVVVAAARFRDVRRVARTIGALSALAAPVAARTGIKAHRPGSAEPCDLWFFGEGRQLPYAPAGASRSRQVSRALHTRRSCSSVTAIS
ncbi:hypothetical protein GCM10023079_32220 [Streptomyces chitinivorans]